MKGGEVRAKHGKTEKKKCLKRGYKVHALCVECQIFKRQLQGHRYPNDRLCELAFSTTHTITHRVHELFSDFLVWGALQEYIWLQCIYDIFCMFGKPDCDSWHGQYPLYNSISTKLWCTTRANGQAEGDIKTFLHQMPVCCVEALDPFLHGQKKKTNSFKIRTQRQQGLQVVTMQSYWGMISPSSTHLGMQNTQHSVP